MNFFRIYLVLYLYITIGSAVSTFRDSTILRKPQKVLLVSIDGFRWDLNRITETPNIDRLIKNGVTADHVLNVFPTKTLPNHQSVVTGLYPEHHGMVDNDFIDKKLGSTFSLQNQRCMEDPKFWQQSLPLWIQVQRQTRYKTGNLFWPGYKVPYRNENLSFNRTLPNLNTGFYYNETPTYLPPKRLQDLYEKGLGDYNKTFYELIDKAVEWLTQDDVIFVPLYSLEPDHTLHESGVEHKDAREQVEQVDRYIGAIYDHIMQHPTLKDQVNAIFIGDHGHVTTSADRMLDLSKLVDLKEDIDRVFGFTNVFLYTKPNKTAKVYEKLKSEADKSTLFRVFLKENIPKYLHIGNNSRTGDILILPEPGWIVVDKTRLSGSLKKPEWTKSEHGYDNMNRDMNPGFFAFGPMFKKGFKKFCIKTVDLYELMCKILGVKPTSNDGKLERVKPLLINERNKTTWDFFEDNIQNNKAMNRRSNDSSVNNSEGLLPSIKDFSKRYKFADSQKLKRTGVEKEGNIRFEIKYDDGGKGRINDNDDEDDYDNDHHPIVCK